MNDLFSRNPTKMGVSSFSSPVAVDTHCEGAELLKQKQRQHGRHAHSLASCKRSHESSRNGHRSGSVAALEWAGPMADWSHMTRAEPG